MYQDFSDDDLTLWRKAISAARKTRDDVSDAYGWQANIDRYRPKDVTKAEGHVNIGADFADVERKKAALFYTTPEIGLMCDEPTQPLAQPQPPPPPNPDGSPSGPPPPPPPTLGAVTLAHQALLNELLSDSQIGIKHTVGQALLDVLLPAGVGPVRVGYTATTQEIPVPVGADPMTQEPMTQVAPVPIHEEFWVTRISPKALLLPAEFRDTDIRKAAWVGHDFTMPVSQFRAEYQIPEDVDIPTSSDAKQFFNEDETKKDSDPPVTGVYLEYRAMLYGKSAHPKAVHTLVLVDGMDAPVKHEPSPHQTIGPDGRLTPDSLRDFSILPLWIRDLPDSAWVPSDSTITAPLTKEINKFRTQIVEQRDSAKQVLLYDPAKLSQEAKAKIDQGEINTLIPVAPGALDAGGAATIMAQVASASMGRDNWAGQDYIQSDREKILGIAANQTGAQSAKKTTATEASIVNRNTEARFNQEQARVLEWYMAVVRTLDALVLRYGDERLASTLIGPKKGQLWAQFKGALAGGYRYEVNTDSGKYMDAEAQRRQWLQFYQMVRQDPMVNPQAIVAKLLSFWGIDPVEGLAQPKPPSPPPPQVGVSFKGEDFNPLNPQFPLVVKMAQQGGWQITPQDIQTAQTQAQQMQQQALIAQAMGGPASDGKPQPSTKHGGPATQQMPLNKRQMGETGGVQNGPVS